MAGSRKTRGGLSTAAFASATGYTVRSIERFIQEGMIVPAARTEGGHARFTQAQVEAVRRWRRHSPYRQPIGPDGEPIPKDPARLQYEARLWARRRLLLRRILSTPARKP